MVMHYKATGPQVSPAKVEEQLRNLPGMPPLEDDLPPIK
jgi:hypothetical protein